MFTNAEAGQATTGAGGGRPARDLEGDPTPVGEGSIGQAGSADKTRGWAYELVTAYCGCGYQLELPDAYHRPTLEPASVRCSCGADVLAKFWRRQEGMVIMRDAWRTPRDRW
jgi:hypothetical protein